MPAESTARTGWMVLLFVCVRPRSPSTRVCGMWFRFIAFVRTVLITDSVRYFFYFILFSIHFSRTEKNVSQNWMREPNTPKKMTSGLFYFIWLLSNWMRWVCINVCHMRVIKWAHGYSLRDVIVWMCCFLFYSGCSFVQREFQSFDSTKESHIRWGLSLNMPIIIATPRILCMHAI